MEYVFSIPIKPQAKERPRFRGHAYTPKKTREFEKYISRFLKPLHLSCQLKIEIVFQFKKPKKPKYDYPSKGDIDNYVKTVLDSMNKIVFNDDSQITKLIAEKKYGENDFIEVRVGTI